MGLRIERVRYGHPDAVRLMAEVQQVYVERYGGMDETPLEAEMFLPPTGTFLVGYAADRAVASGAWRRRDDVERLGTHRLVEVKRMYVVPGARGAGHARAILARLEETARETGAEAVVLETGTAQPEAIALYGSSGYEEVEKFGHYRHAPESRCFGKRLVPAADGKAASAAGPPAAEPPAAGPPTTASPRTAGVAAEWDAEAPAFDDEPDHGLRDPDVRAAWRRLLLDVLPPAPARVADPGCGTGTLADLLAREGFAVDGVDLSPAMVERARAKTAGLTVTAVVGDAEAPPLDRSAYDVVLCRHVLWALPDPVVALGRWVDLLAPGGRLVLVEGRWGTGAGLGAAESEALVRRHRAEVEVRPLPEPHYWGGAIDDERYLLLSRR